MDVTVIIPTTNRATLPACLASVRDQEHDGIVQVVVVDDAPARRVDRQWLAREAPGALLVLGDGEGPAVARNMGLAQAKGEVVFFTDDDVIVDSGWIAAGCAYLDAEPLAAGVEGVVTTAPYDYLFEQSLENDRPGAFWTCNVAYRRAAIEAVGGFCEDFPWPHGEDRDLALRILRHGPIGFCHSMRVVHTPRRVGLGEAMLQGRWVLSSIALARRHPEHFPATGVLAEARHQLAGGLRYWLRRLRDDRHRLARSPRLLARLVALASGHLLVSAGAIARSRIRERVPS